jgi:5-methylcytosine-specific restriction endonuclease McrA
MATPDSTDLLLRADAKAAGLTKYTSTKRCQRCETSSRFTRDGKCVECNRLACQRRYQAKMAPKAEALAAMRAKAREVAAAKKAASKVARKVAHARTAAKLANALTYVGRPCQEGHSGVRYTGYGTCVQCASNQARSPEKKAYDKARYETVKDHVRARSAAYYAANAEQAKLTSKAWGERNPERRTAIKQNYKHRRRTTEKAGMSSGELNAWKAAQKKVCYWCGAKCDKAFVVDHYEPLAKGGKHEAGNLVIACRPCNAQKSAKDPLAFAQSRGRLF